MTITEMRSKYAGLLDDATAITNAADHEARDLTAAEETRFNSLMTEVTRLRKTIESRETLDTENEWANLYTSTPVDGDGYGDTRNKRVDATTTGGTLAKGGNPTGIVGAPYIGRRSAAPTIMKDAEGHELRFAGSHQRITTDKDPDFHLGDLVRSLVTGEQTELRAQAVNQDSTGGFALKSWMMPRVIDLIRDASTVVAAGAGTIKTSTRDTVIGKINENATGAWVPENGTIPETDLDFGAQKIRLRKVAAIVTSSREFMQFATNAGQIIEGNIVAGLASEIDRAALFGDGSGEEPVGLFNTEGINTLSSVGVPTWADIFDAMAEVEADNGDPNALIWSPGVSNFYRKLVDGEGVYLNTPQAASTVRRLLTNKMADTQFILGDFSQMAIVVPDFGTRIEIGVPDSAGFSKDQVSIKVVMYRDVVVLRPDHFCALPGVDIS